MTLFRKLPSLPRGLGRLPPVRPPSSRRPTVSRYRVSQPDAGPSYLESRAAQDVQGTLPERIVIQELRRRNEDFDYQDQFGGKLNVGGMLIDIIIYSRTPFIALEILSDWNRPPLANPYHEPLKAAMVEAMGYRFASLNDDTDIFPSRQRLETLLDDILGQSILLMGIPSGGSLGGPGPDGGVPPPTGDDEAMAMLEIAKLRGEIASLRALVENHGNRHNIGGSDSGLLIGKAKFLEVISDVRKYFHVFRDFGLDDIGLEWGEDATGLGASVDPVTNTRNGEVECVSGTSATGRAGQAYAPTRLNWINNLEMYMEGRFALLSALGTNSGKQFGFADLWTDAAPANSIMVEVVGTGNWQAVTRSASGARTATSLGIAAALNTPYVFVIKVSAQGTLVQFEMWSEATPRVLIASAQHTTQIPTVGLDLFFKSRNDVGGAGDTVSRNLRCDYVFAYQYRQAGGF